MTSFTWRVLALLTAVCAVGGCVTTGRPIAAAPAARAERAPVYPGAEWERVVDPNAIGWDRTRLDAVTQKLATLPSTGFMAVVGGRVLMQYGNVDTVTYLASVRKSLLSMMVGIYAERGTIALDRTLAQMGMDDLKGLTDTEKQATFRHLLMARSGVYHPAANPGDDAASAPPRGSQQPGAYFLYNNWDFNAAGAAFEKQTGLNIFDAFATELAGPIGMRDFNRATHVKSGDLTASKYPAYHFNLSTRDMARIGYLMLRDGKWNERQIVPRAWVKESTRAHTSVGAMNPASKRNGPWGYGYLWWVWDGKDAVGPFEGAYTGLGAVGQHIAVLPKLDLVVVHKTAPGRGVSVTHPQFIEVLTLLLQAKR